MYYTKDSDEYLNLLNSFKVADKLQTSIGLFTSIEQTHKLLSFEWNTVKNDSIKNTELYEFEDMTKIFIRPHFDIDFNWNKINEKLANDIKELALYKIKDHFDVSIDDISISECHRDEKCSFHMVITNMMTTMESLSKWSNDFKQELEMDHFDLSIYRLGLSKWRMLNTIKKVTKNKKYTEINAFKKISNHDDLDFFITYTNPETMKIIIYNSKNYTNNLPNLKNEINYNISNIDDILYKLDLINPNQVENYNDTIKFIWSCVSSKSELIINKCRDICKLNKKYYDDESWFDKIVESYDDKSNFTIATALYMAKESNPEQFKLITQKYKYSDENTDLLYNAINKNSDYPIAKYYCFKYPNTVLVYKGDMYYYKNGFWRFMDDNNFSIKKTLATSFYDIFNNELIKLKEEQNKLDDNDENKNKRNLLKFQITNLNKICYKLHSSGSKESLIKEICVASSNEDIHFDEKINLLNFNNGTLNLDTNEFKEHDPLDYITKIIPFNYNPNKYSNNEKNNIINKIASIFQLKEELDYILWRISKCFKGGNYFQEAIYWIGEGRNGKGILSDLVSIVFGSYYETMNISYITSIDKNANSPNAELLKLKGCRIVIINEPDKNQPINSIKFKSLTGNDLISARDLFKKSTQFIKFKPQFTPFFLTNSTPSFTTLDDAIIARLCIVNFPFYFGYPGDNKYNINNPNHKLRNNNLLNELTENIEIFLHVLLDYFKINNLDKPNSIVNYQKKMILEINTVAGFCAETIEDDLNNGRIGIADLYTYFKESPFNTNNISQNLFTEKIRKIYPLNFSDKRLKINNKLQYYLKNKKLNQDILNQISNNISDLLDIIESEEE